MILKSCGVWAQGRGVSKDRFFTLGYCNLEARGPSDGGSGSCMLTTPGNGTATNRGQSEDGLELGLQSLLPSRQDHIIVLNLPYVLAM